MRPHADDPPPAQTSECIPAGEEFPGQAVAERATVAVPLAGARSVAPRPTVIGAFRGRTVVVVLSN